MLFAGKNFFLNTLLYSRLIIQSLAALTLTPKYVKGLFMLNSVLSCPSSKFVFFVYRKRHYIYSRHKYLVKVTLGPIGDMYKPEASKYSKSWNI